MCLVWMEGFLASGGILVRRVGMASLLALEVDVHSEDDSIL